ncbi:hypothetical protein J6590_037372 [Homalodisca vitripennis]|nr:hypothetical protein J6590_037372 [Homalodisca vitripennis]
MPGLYIELAYTCDLGRRAGYRRQIYRDAVLAVGGGEAGIFESVISSQPLQSVYMSITGSNQGKRSKSKAEQAGRVTEGGYEVHSHPHTVTGSDQGKRSKSRAEQAGRVSEGCRYGDAALAPPGISTPSGYDVTAGGSLPYRGLSQPAAFTASGKSKNRKKSTKYLKFNYPRTQCPRIQETSIECSIVNIKMTYNEAMIGRIDSIRMLSLAPVHLPSIAASGIYATSAVSDLSPRMTIFVKK